MPVRLEEPVRLVKSVRLRGSLRHGDIVGLVELVILGSQ